MKKSTRLNLSIPEDLYNRLVEECPEVNWSALCRQAFETFLAGGVERQIYELEAEVARLRSALLAIKSIAEQS